VGAIAYLILITASIFLPNHRSPATFALLLVSGGVAVGCAGFGILDGYRSRRANRRRS
jgi:hypothetical protein